MLNFFILIFLLLFWPSLASHVRIHFWPFTGVLREM
jgi:hypothetical protein